MIKAATRSKKRIKGPGAVRPSPTPGVISTMKRLQLCAPASLLCLSTEELALLLIGTSTE